MAPSGTSELRSWLTAIGALTAAVNAGHGLSALLDLVAATAHDLLDLDFCGVMLPTPDGASLTIAGASRLPDEYATRVHRSRPIPLEAGATTGAPASRAFRSGRPCSVTDVAAEPSSTWRTVAREQGYGSILAVPLIARAGVLGTLNSYRAAAHEFRTHEVEQLELLAEHAAIALTSARIVDDLREQHRLVSRSEEIHDRLVRVAVRSGGVAGITSVLHDLLGCDVVVRDVHGATLAAEGDPASATGLVPRPRAPGQRGLVYDEGPHVVADVVLDGAVVATVRLRDQAGKLDALGVQAAEHASVVLSLELLRQRTAAEVEQALRGELLADLLAGADPEAPLVRDRATLMGHHLGVPHRTLVAQARDGSVTGTGAEAVRTREQTAQRAAAEAVRRTSHLRPRPLIASVRGVVVALWPENVDGPAGDVVLRRAIAATGAVATVAVAGPDDDGIPAAYRVARGALAFAGVDSTSRGVVTLDDLGAAGLLLRFAEPAELRRYAERTLGAVRRYDADHGAELLRTLRVYLDCELDRRATGELLVLHPNTVSQRLRRIETLTGLDLRSPRSMIDARAALMLIDVADAAGGAPARRPV